MIATWGSWSAGGISIIDFVYGCVSEIVVLQLIQDNNEPIDAQEDQKKHHPVHIPITTTLRCRDSS